MFILAIRNEKRVQQTLTIVARAKFHVWILIFTSASETSLEFLYNSDLHLHSTVLKHNQLQYSFSNEYGEEMEVSSK